METLRKKILEIWNTVRQIKNGFDEFISRLVMTEERISRLKDRWIEISKLQYYNTKIQREKE